MSIVGRRGVNGLLEGKKKQLNPAWAWFRQFPSVSPVLADTPSSRRANAAAVSTAVAHQGVGLLVARVELDVVAGVGARQCGAAERAAVGARVRRHRRGMITRAEGGVRNGQVIVGGVEPGG